MMMFKETFRRSSAKQRGQRVCGRSEVISPAEVMVFGNVSSGESRGNLFGQRPQYFLRALIFAGAAGDTVINRE